MGVPPAPSPPLFAVWANIFLGHCDVSEAGAHFVPLPQNNIHVSMPNLLRIMFHEMFSHFQFFESAICMILKRNNDVSI